MGAYSLAEINSTKTPTACPRSVLRYCPQQALVGVSRGVTRPTCDERRVPPLGGAASFLSFAGGAALCVPTFLSFFGVVLPLLGGAALPLILLWSVASLLSRVLLGLLLLWVVLSSSTSFEWCCFLLSCGSCWFLLLFLCGAVCFLLLWVVLRSPSPLLSVVLLASPSLVLLVSYST